MRATWNAKKAVHRERNRQKHHNGPQLDENYDSVRNDVSHIVSIKPKCGVVSKRIHAATLHNNSTNGFKRMGKMKNCANCGQRVAENEGYSKRLFGEVFCCESCYEEYTAKHPKKAGCAKKIGCLQLIIAIIGILGFILYSMSNGDGQKSDNGSNTPVEQVQE